MKRKIYQANTKKNIREVDLKTKHNQQDKGFQGSSAINLNVPQHSITFIKQMLQEIERNTIIQQMKWSKNTQEYRKKINYELSTFNKHTKFTP